MPSVYTEDVARLLEWFRPASILQLDPEDTELFSRYLQANPACEIERLGRSDIIAQLKGKGRYAFSFVANTLENLDKEAAGQVIAKLCRWATTGRVSRAHGSCLILSPSVCA
jgi:hypothetical protein